MLIAPSQCGPDETAVAALWWAYVPTGWIKGRWGQTEAWHDTTLLWDWFEVSEWKAPSCLWFAPPRSQDLKAGAVSYWAHPQIPLASDRTGWDCGPWYDSFQHGLLTVKATQGNYQICLDEYCRGHVGCCAGIYLLIITWEPREEKGWPAWASLISSLKHQSLQRQNQSGMQFSWEDLMLVKVLKSSNKYFDWELIKILNFHWQVSLIKEFLRRHLFLGR